MLLILGNLQTGISQEWQLSSSEGTFVPLTGGTNVSGIQNDEGYSGAIDIGFDFVFNGETYHQLVASSNGVLWFNVDYVETFVENSISSYEPGLSIIAPFWDDLSGDEGTASYELQGTAPNRIFTFEWLNWKWDYTAVSPSISFQVKLYETSNRIDFIYRQEGGDISSGGGGFGASIGLVLGNNGFGFLTNSGTAPELSSSIETNSITERPATSQQYTFIYGFKPEPSGQATLFTASSSCNVVTLNWTDAQGEVVPDGYLILASKSNSFSTPVDSVDEVNDLDLSDGSGLVKVAKGSQVFDGFQNAEFYTTYYFKIFSFTNSEININYKTDGEPPLDSTLVVPLDKPDGNATMFEATTDGEVITLDWIDATGTILPQGYLILVSDNNTFEEPVDGVDPEIDKDLSDNKAVVKVAKGAETYSDFLNLQRNKTYYFKIYSYTNFGEYIVFNTENNPQTSVLFIKPEPSNHATYFQSKLRDGKILQTWTDASGTTKPDGYVIFASQQNNFTNPTDNVEVTVDNDLNDGMGCIKVDYGVGKYSDWVNGNIDTLYYFKIYPYTNSENYIDYKTSGTVPVSIYTYQTIFNEVAGNTVETSIYGSIDMGDYDNDGFQDIIRTGSAGSSNPATMVYHNNGDGSFTEQTSIILDGVFYGTGKWVDYNNDGFLDIFLMGAISSGTIAKLYSNNGDGTFTEIAKANLKPLVASDGSVNSTMLAAWGDFNNDGNIDLIYSGEDNFNQFAYLMRNNGDSTFTEVSGFPFSGIYTAFDWGDYNNDGYLDLLTTGNHGYGTYDTKLYKNNGDNTFTLVTNSGLMDFNGKGKWGDYDNDGYLDILFSGRCNEMYDPTVEIFHNNGDGTFSKLTASKINASWGVDVAWGDYNNDGYLDILKSSSSGYYYYLGYGSALYLNNRNGIFAVDTLTTLQSSSASTVAWFDMDNDNDLDFLINGDYSKLYENESYVKNVKPKAPENPKSKVNGTTVTLSWDKSNDGDTTLTGISYNLYIGTSPDSQNVFAADADLLTGLRKVTKRGTLQTTSLTLRNLKGGNYYWGAQAIDAGFAGSEFSTQSTFSVIHFNSISPAENDTLICGETGTPVTVNESMVSDSSVWKYSLTAGGPYNYRIENGGSKTWTPQFTHSGIYYVVCVSYFGDEEVTSNEILINIQQFTEIALSSSFKALSDGDMAWGDYDNDGDLDLVITGLFTSPSYTYTRISAIFKNNGDGTFTEQTTINLTGVSNGSVDWGDIDNDGYLDILLSGSTNGENSGAITKVYHNNQDNSFTELNYALSGIKNGSAAWVDYNNDGQSDIFISGYGTDGVMVFKLYENNNGVLTEKQQNITPFADGKFDFGDYNNDGYTDIIMSGFDYNGNRMTRIYSNSGDGTFSDLGVNNLLGINYSSVKWGDYDNDGYLDILLAGLNYTTATSTRIYRNNGDSTFTEQTGISLDGVVYNSIEWGDYDNDGFFDIALSGLSILYTTNGISKVYHNNGYGTFTEPENISFEGVCTGTSKWGDYDNDGDLDLFLFGKTKDVYSPDGTIKLYRNNCVVKKTPVSKIQGLNTEIVSREQVILKWNRPTDIDYKPYELTYNVVMAKITATDTIFINSPLSDMNTGFRKIVKNGNAGNDTTFIFKGLSEGKYIWAVQSINKTYSGSEFSDWSEFEILSPFTEIQNLAGYNDNINNWIDYNNDGLLDIYLTGDEDYISNGYVYTVGKSKFYQNHGDSTFPEDTNQSFPGVYYSINIGSSYEDDASLNYNGGIAWGDYNNDGFPDIFMSGDTINNGTYPQPKIARVYSNNGDGTFTKQDKISVYALTGSPCLDWIDYDNDGKQDIFIAGAVDLSYSQLRLYHNNGDSTFTQLYNAIAWDLGTRSDAAWGDYNNDGYLDLLISGESSLLGSCVSRIYKNNGDGTFSLQDQFSLPSLRNSNVSWADYNNDGLLDFLISGWGSEYNRITKIFRNNGDNTFTDINAFIRGVVGGNVIWGDYDNDGDLDILMCGISSKVVNSIYRNDGNGVFTEQDFGFQEGQHGFSSFGDYDNDGDLDILSSCYGVSKIYRNNSYSKNKAPTTPHNLAIKRTNNTYHFMWDAATDDKTPAVSLTYNLRIGTTPGGRDILSPLSISDTNKLLLPAMGNCQLSKTKEIHSLTPGTYYWSVQAVDQAFIAGPWATEQQLVVSAVVADFTADTVCAGLPTTFNDISVEFNEPITQWTWKFDSEGTSTDPSPSFTFSKAGTFNVTLIVQTASFIDSIIKTVMVKSVPVADFTASPVCFGTATSFTNTSVIPSDFEVSSWNWDFGDDKPDSKPTTQNPGSHTYVSANTYSASLKIVGANGCSDSISNNVLVVPQPDANIFISSGSLFSFCKNSGDSACLSVNFQENCTYQWLLNDVPLNGYTLNSITIKEDGGNYKALVTNQMGGCAITSVNPVTITINNSPEQPSIIYDNQGITFCSGDSLKMQTTQIAGLNYLWKRDGGLVGQDPVYQAKQTGIYTLTVVNPLNGCDAVSPDEINVTVNPKPTLPSVTYGETTVCQGTNVSFSVTNNPDYAYQWMNGDVGIPGLTTNQYTATQSGNYWLQITNSSLCTVETNPVEVIVNPTPVTPVINDPSENSLCSGDSVILQTNSVSGVIYQWLLNGGNTGTDSSAIYAKTSGTYTLKVTNGSACSAVSSNSIPITVNSRPVLPSVNYGETEFCQGGSVTFSVTNNSAYTYQWINEESEIPGANTNLFTAKERGTYWLRITNSSTCSVETSPVEVIVNPNPEQPTINEPAYTSFCEGDSVILYVNPIENITYQWLLNGGATGSGTNKLVVKSGGSYNMKVINSFQCQSLSANTVQITVNSLPQVPSVSYGETHFCEGNSVTFSVINNQNYNYQWKKSYEEITGATSYQYTTNVEGLYWLEVSNEYCSIETSPVTVEVDLKPSIPIIKEENNKTLFCPGTEINLLVDNASSAYQYQWKRSGIIISGADQSYYQGKLSGGDYSVMVTSGLCNVESSILTLTTKPAPEKPEIYAKGPNLWILGCSNDSAVDYRWYYNDQLISGAKEPIYFAGQNLGNYSVEINEGGDCWTMSNVINIPTGDIINGVDDLNSNEVFVYPNPSSDKFNISFGATLSGAINTVITDEVGKIVERNVFHSVSGCVINLYDTKPGIYFCKIEHRGIVVVKKLVKQ